jgi:hypothetical protein
MATVLIASATASNDATIEFTLTNTDYTSYQVVLDSLLPATDGAELFMRFSSDGGSTFDSGTGNYRYASRWIASNGAIGSTSGESATAINLTNTVGTSAGETGANGKLDLISSGEGRPSVRWQLSRTSSSNLLVYQNGGAERTATVEVDAIQFTMSTGNIASGKVYLYGLEKAESGSAVVFVEASATVSGTDIDLSLANVFSKTLTADTTFTFSNPPATGTAYGFTLKVTQDSTARTITWPASVDWPVLRPYSIYRLRCC